MGERTGRQKVTADKDQWPTIDIVHENQQDGLSEELDQDHARAGLLYLDGLEIPIRRAVAKD